MKIYRDLDKLPSFKNAVITIGSFDGVHIGHQQIIKKIQLAIDHNNHKEMIAIFKTYVEGYNS